MDERSWSKLLKSFVSHQLELEVPTFTSQSVLNLNESLISLGITEAFGDKADFSGINGGKSLRISSFLQANKFSLENNSRRKREVVARVVEVVVEVNPSGLPMLNPSILMVDLVVVSARGLDIKLFGSRITENLSSLTPPGFLVEESFSSSLLLLDTNGLWGFN